MGSSPSDRDLAARDLAVFWHPCSQMRDYRDFPPLEVVGARGTRLRLADGREILDAIASWWCKTLGHGHPRLLAALRAQADAFEHVITANTTSAPLVRLCERLLAAANGLPPAAFGADAPPGRRPGHFGKVFLADNGSTAVEIALKMALQAQAQRGAPRRTRFAALENGYHGETVGALSVGDLALYAAPYRAICFPVERLSGCLTAADRARAATIRAWLDASAEWPAIEAALDAQADTLAAVVYEPDPAGGRRDAPLQPRSAAPPARLGRCARRLPHRRRDRGRAWAASARCWRATSPTGRAASRRRRSPTSRCCRRG